MEKAIQLSVFYSARSIGRKMEKGKYATKK